MTPGVLVLHPWWGLNEDVRASAERLRHEGYEVAAPDLFHGRVATTRDEAKALSGEVSKNWKGAMSEIEEALAKLQADRVAVLAWSMGVWFSWQLAQAHPDRIRGLVSYYGYGEIEPGKSLTADPRTLRGERRIRFRRGRARRGAKADRGEACRGVPRLPRHEALVR